MGKMDREVFIIESFVPTAVTMVAVANMFRLEPRKASMLFIVNTVMYLVVVLPIVLWLFGQ
jgi:predicted permease